MLADIVHKASTTRSTLNSTLLLDEPTGENKETGKRTKEGERLGQRQPQCEVIPHVQSEILGAGTSSASCIIYTNAQLMAWIITSTMINVI